MCDYVCIQYWLLIEVKTNTLITHTHTPTVKTTQHHSWLSDGSAWKNSQLVEGQTKNFLLLQLLFLPSHLAIGPCSFAAILNFGLQENMQMHAVPSAAVSDFPDLPFPWLCCEAAKEMPMMKRKPKARCQVLIQDHWHWSSNAIICSPHLSGQCCKRLSGQHHCKTRSAKKRLYFRCDDSFGWSPT